MVHLAWCAVCDYDKLMTGDYCGARHLHPQLEGEGAFITVVTSYCVEVTGTPDIS